MPATRQTKLNLRLGQSQIEGEKTNDWVDGLEPMTRKLLGAAVSKDDSQRADLEDYKTHLRLKHLGTASNP